jgi:hypothetical protein
MGQVLSQMAMHVMLVLPYLLFSQPCVRLAALVPVTAGNSRRKGSCVVATTSYPTKAGVALGGACVGRKVDARAVGRAGRHELGITYARAHDFHITSSAPDGNER